MSKTVVLHQVVKRFGATLAVDGVSFEAQAGTVTGLLGRNGAGKTTTIRMITGILLADSGSIELLGNTRTPAALRDRIGYLPEERGLYEGMRVRDLVVFFAELKGLRRAAARRATERWLQRLELWDKRETKLEELSKGNQQKVQLACALAHEPDIVVLDEPLSGLDPVNAVLLREIVAELRSRGATVLLSTHRMDLAESITDAIIIIDRGRVVADGSAASLRRGHAPSARILLEFDGDGSFLASLRGVAHATLRAGAAEIELESTADAHEVLRDVMARVRVRRFERASPSLEAVFLERVGAPAGGA